MFMLGVVVLGSVVAWDATFSDTPLQTVSGRNARSACCSIRIPSLAIVCRTNAGSVTRGRHDSPHASGVQILLRLPKDLATTLLRVTVDPHQQAPPAEEPAPLSIPGQLRSLRHELFPLILHACAPCIDAHSALAVRVAPDSHSILVAALPHLTTLTALTIVIPRFDATDVNVSLLMRAVRRLPNLARLSVTDEESNSQRMVSLALSLAAAPSLNTLSLTIPGEPSGMGLLLNALQQRQPQTLQALELSCTLTDVHAPQLGAMLPGLTALRKLTLRHARLSHDHAADLVTAVAALPGLTSLALDHVLRFRGDADTLCAAIGRVTTLRSLQLREAPGGIPLLTGLGAALERHVSACAALTTLDVGCSLPRDNLKPLGGLLRRLPGLCRLSVRGARRLYDDLSGLSAFAAALRQLQCLTALDLGGCAITVPVAVEIAAALPTLSALRVLWLDSACMHAMYDSWSEPASYIAPALTHMASLQDLHVDNCSLGPAGAATLAAALAAMPWLRGLQLQQNRLCVDGVRVLTPALAKLTRLQVLNLARNEITGEAMELLACGFRGLLDLRELDLSGNPLSPRGAAAFASGVSTAVMPWGGEVGPPGAAADAQRPVVQRGGSLRLDVASDEGTLNGGASPLPEDEGPISTEHPGGLPVPTQTALMRLERLQVDRCSLGPVGLETLLTAVRVMHGLQELCFGLSAFRAADAEAAFSHLETTNPSLYVT